MSLLETLLREPATPAEERREVVRLTTTYWTGVNGLSVLKKLTPQKRKSTGYQMLLEDAKMIGDELVVKNIVNLNECKDGLYSVEVVNERTDFETGYVEDYDYKLIPFTEPA